MRPNLQKELSEMCAHNKDGSLATQANRTNILNQCARTLQRAGFRDLDKNGLKPKHIDTLLQQWRADNLSAGTMKNRMAAVRWWSQKINKHNVVPRTNDKAGIERRTYLRTYSKGQTLTREQLDAIPHERLQVSLELQAAFGLRREEAMKFIPSYADKKDHIELKGSWCKGGREREIPIRTEYQREVLARAHALAGKGSMIPPDKSYKEWLSTYEKSTQRADLSDLHGLRHQYAQDRFEELAGFKCPVAGGPSREELTEEQKAQDYNARMTVSNELGHAREEITATYLGR